VAEEETATPEPAAALITRATPACLVYEVPLAASAVAHQCSFRFGVRVSAPSPGTLLPVVGSVDHSPAARGSGASPSLEVPYVCPDDPPTLCTGYPATWTDSAASAGMLDTGSPPSLSPPSCPASTSRPSNSPPSSEPCTAPKHQRT
jgi:hypothetical protein